jgi:hypothetical protein
MIMLQGDGCPYLDDWKWFGYERAATYNWVGEVPNPNAVMAWTFWEYWIIRPSTPNYCPFKSRTWAIFQIYVAVELEWWWVEIDTHGSPWIWNWSWNNKYRADTVFSFEKYYVAH